VSAVEEGVPVTMASLKLEKVLFSVVEGVDWERGEKETLLRDFVVGVLAVLDCLVVRFFFLEVLEELEVL